MGLADLHIHTIYSWDGTCTVSAVLKYAAEQTALDVIAITDHDEIRGSIEALELAPSYGIQVIPGSEISTAEGHLLALFIESRVPAGLSLVETVQRVGALGGLCFAAHPMAANTNSLTEKTIFQALQHPEVADVLVGIETFNAGILHRNANMDALVLAHTLSLTRIGSSDSHLLQTIGQASTEFQGTSPDDLRIALENRTTHVQVGKLSSEWAFLRNWFPRYLLRNAGWATGNLDPHEPLRLRRFTRT
jgi:predicted metal-dependent phosphoesterase TrpH